MLGTDYNSALLLDEELAQQQVELGMKPSKNPPLRGWTPEIQALYDVADVILRAAAAQGGQNARTVEGFPRPLTARQLVAKRKSKRNYLDIVAKAKPKRKPL